MTLGETDLRFATQTECQVLTQPGVMADLPEHLLRLGLGPQVVIITDQTVNRLYGQDLERLLQASGFAVEIVELPVGEQHKSVATVNRVYSLLKAASVDRGTVVIALGGGVVGDMAGLVAATWQRGLPLVQVPTTLLAQVDSSIGGKAAVNHLGLKNLIGVFKHPQLVLVDPILLATLPLKEYRAGLAEVVKTALLSGPDMWGYMLEQQTALLQRESAVVAEVIERCLAYKAAVVSRDPEDRGERRVLNLGHTVGHAVEELASQHYSHGEAVSVGLCFALEMSREVGLVSAVVEQAREMLQRFGLPTKAPGLDEQRLLQLLRRDKKAVGGVTRWVLLPALGQPLVTPEAPPGWQDMLVRMLRSDD